MNKTLAADPLSELNARLELERAARCIYGEDAECWTELGHRYGAGYVRSRLVEGWTAEEVEWMCATGLSEEEVRIVYRMREMQSSIQTMGRGLSEVGTNMSSALQDFRRAAALLRDGDAARKARRRRKARALNGAPWPAAVARRPGWRS